MKLLLDTNIIVDVLSQREGYEESLKILKFCEARRVKGYVSAVTVTDVVYILRKYVSSDSVRHALSTLLSIVDVADVTKTDIKGALSHKMKDFEDAVQAMCARRLGTQYIVTRNLKDFESSPVQAISSEMLLPLLT